MSCNHKFFFNHDYKYKDELYDIQTLTHLRIPNIFICSRCNKTVGQVIEELEMKNKCLSEENEDLKDALVKIIDYPRERGANVKRITSFGK